jgi:hypothetical protein
MTDMPTEVGCSLGQQACDTGKPRLEAWSGRGWTNDPTYVTPTIATAAMGNSDAPFPYFTGAACISTTRCLVVGNVSDTSVAPGYASDPFADIGSSGAWALSTVPMPPSSTGAKVESVSCTAGLCMAVGDATVGGAVVPLADVWSGGAWQLASRDTTAHGTLAAISCARGSCEAVGSTGRGVAQVPLVERWAKGRWRRQHDVVPARSRARDGSSLIGVSCVAKTCTSVGNFNGHFDAASGQNSDSGWFIERSAL